MEFSQYVIYTVYTIRFGLFFFFFCFQKEILYNHDSKNTWGAVLNVNKNRMQWFANPFLTIFKQVQCKDTKIIFKLLNFIFILFGTPIDAVLKVKFFPILAASVAQQLCHILRFIIRHTFSMGDRSEPQAGQSRTHSLSRQSCTVTQTVAWQSPAQISMDVPEKDIVRMAAYVAPKPVCTF